MTATEKPERLGQRLLARGDVDPLDLDRALAWQAAHGGRLGEALLRLGALSEDTLYAALGQQLGLSLLEDASAFSGGQPIWLSRRSGPSRDWWRRQQALAWTNADGECHVASVDVLQDELRETLEAQGIEPTQWWLVSPGRFEMLAGALDTDVATADAPLDSRALRELAEDAPVIAYVNGVLAQAVEERASDIHFEPGEHQFVVRLRVDGVLQELGTQPISRYPAVASRIKLVSGLDIAERRLPQDGRTSIRLAGQGMDVRVSVIPAVHGESLVLRLLPKQRQDLSLDRLGLSSDHLSMWKRWLGWPNGLILVTGPTGSGKSTTLYAALAAVSDQQRKMVTVEDPVEFRLPGVVQIQTQAEIGYTFARALRSILRHDPDIIMVGEIRDRETAEIAIQSALTGHLVLATLHTNDALSAVTRLTDMGVEPYLVAAALRGVIAQRLVRVLCRQCAIPIREVDVDPGLQAQWDALGQAGVIEAQGTGRWYQAVGCPQCGKTGFRGRRGIYELVQFDAEMQHAIAHGAAMAKLTALADAAGRRTLAGDGLLKVGAGLTTWSEVLRAAGQVGAD